MHFYHIFHFEWLLRIYFPVLNFDRNPERHFKIIFDMLQQQLIRLKKVFVRSNSQFVLTSKKGYFESRKASKKFYVMCVACRSIKQKFYFQQKKSSSNSVNLVIFVDAFQNIACTTIYQNIKKRTWFCDLLIFSTIF